MRRLANSPCARPETHLNAAIVTHDRQYYSRCRCYSGKYLAFVNKALLDDEVAPCEAMIDVLLLLRFDLGSFLLGRQPASHSHQCCHRISLHQLSLIAMLWAEIKHALYEYRTHSCNSGNTTLACCCCCLMSSPAPRVMPSNFDKCRSSKPGYR